MKAGLLTLFALLCTSFLAAAENGTITGRVSSAATGAYLEGVEVSVVGQPAITLTARDGTFLLSALPPGAHSVRVYYTGLEMTTKTVTVSAGQAAELNIALTSVVQMLETFTVSSSREGEAASVVKQRNALNVMNVVSMEAFGHVADGNVGNFMVRLPGVSADYENGEVLGIKIRGTPAELSSINVDGVRVASASVGNVAGDRSAQIDTIPAEFIKEVELSKAPTPDMPADSIGGSANLVTKSALDFDRDVLTYRAGINYNSFRRDLHTFAPNAALSYLTRIGAQRNLGLALSLTHTETEAPRDRVQMTRNQPDGRNTQARTLTNVNNRVRLGAGLKLDYRVNQRASVYAKFNYNYYDFNSPRDVLAIAGANGNRVADYGRVSRAQIEAGTVPRDSTNNTAGIAPGFTDSFTEMLQPTFTHQVTNNIRQFWNFTAETGGQILLPGDQKLVVQASYNPSKATGNLRAFTLTYRGAPFGYSIDTSRNRSRPDFRQTFGPTVGFGSDFSQYTAVFSYAPEDHVTDDLGNVKLDYTKNFKSAPWPLEFRAGANWRNQYHRSGSYSPSWDFAGADGVAGRNAASGLNDDNLAQFRTTEPVYTVFNRGGVWPQMDGIDFTKVFELFKSQPQLFRAQGTTVSGSPTVREIGEDVYAAYAMGRAQLGRLDVLGGVRDERTDIDAESSLTDARQPTLTRTDRTGSYQKFFPSVHLKYRLTPKFLARASFSTGSTRPNMADLYPTTSVSYNASTGLGTVTSSNPGLKPQYAKNYDVALEYYVEPAGLITIGGFRKDIKDFISRNSQIIEPGPGNGFNGDYAGFSLNTTDNLGSAKIEGLEFNYNQQLVFLPKPFNAMRVFANYTRLRTSGTYADGVVELVGFVPKTVNAGASWRWRKLETRVAWNYQGTTLRTYNVNIYAAQRSRPVETTDINLKYYFSPRFSVFVDAINIGNRWQEIYSGVDEGRVVISDSYGSRFNMGITGRF
jgi:iron complex outermembrane receptor protein